jgi:hypothetical protein
MHRVVSDEAIDRADRGDEPDSDKRGFGSHRGYMMLCQINKPPPAD